jgi:3,4-dihydroxy 2-butanone 4-phosphate synthase/GTP cyclohydrolase II
MKMMHHNECGLIILPYGHEGRGIGFENKVRCYHLMQNDSSLDTYSANVALGFPEDIRDYRDCKKILDFLDINDFVLLTSNPEKIAALNGLRFRVFRGTLSDAVNETNEKYIKTKLKKHLKDEKCLHCCF